MDYGDMFATSPPNNRRASMSTQRPAAEGHQRRHSRPVDTNFGSQLANARNQTHPDTPPTLPREHRRSIGGMIASQVADSVRETAHAPPGAPLYGRERGSYRSPFEYNIPGRYVGARKHSSSQGMPPFSPPSRPQSISFGSMPPVDTRAPPNKAAHATGPEHGREPLCRAVTPGFDAKERLLLLGPLLVIQNTSAALCKEDREVLHTFIDKYMGESLRTVAERDAILPQIVYKISIPMTDANWQKYNQLLSVFTFANSMHKMLAVGAEEFDKYSFVADAGLGKEHVEGWKVLASARSRGIDMERLLQEIVQKWKSTWE